MERYIALLRGINISGKNRIAMSELKANFSALGFTDVVTHLNSGNVVFSGAPEKAKTFSAIIRAMILERFELDIPVFVILQKELKDLLCKAPDWWGTDNQEKYDNLIFVIPPSTAEAIAGEIGEPSEELEEITICGNAIFWSFDRKKYAKANWWRKTASAGISERITIRTANTLKKIVSL